MINIAIVDVAAESGGALSVLTDFYNYVKYSAESKQYNWIFFTSVISFETTENIHVISDINIKKSWLHRLYWEHVQFKKIVKKYKIDIIFSLQNKALPIKNIRQVVYFHNVLLLERPDKFSFVKKDEWKYAVYVKIIAPMTIRSYRYCDEIITQTQTVKKLLEAKTNNNKIFAVYPHIEMDVTNETSQIQGLIYPASPYKYKNHLSIIQALLTGGIDPEFKIIFTFNGNENIYASQLRQLASGISNIKFAGFLPREKLLSYYKDYGLICASELESFPIPFIEAMHYGAPIIACNYDYAEEILENYDNKILCGQDVQSLNHALQKACGMRRRKGQSFETQGNSWAAVMDILLNKYEQSVEH